MKNVKMLSLADLENKELDKEDEIRFDEYMDDRGEWGKAYLTPESYLNKNDYIYELNYFNEMYRYFLVEFEKDHNLYRMKRCNK